MDFSKVSRFWKEDAVASEVAAASAEKALAGGEKQVSGTAKSRDKQKAQMATQKTTPVKSDVSYTSEGYKPFPKDKVTRKVKALDAEKAMGLDGDTREKKAKNAKRRMKMDMAVYVDKDPELRGMHRSAKQTIEKENRERGRKKMEEERRLEREMASNYAKQKSDWRSDLTEAMKPDTEGTHPYVDVMPFVNQKAMEAKKQMKGAASAKMDTDKDAAMTEGYKTFPVDKVERKLDTVQDGKGSQAEKNRRVGKMDGEVDMAKYLPDVQKKTAKETERKNRVKGLNRLFKKEELSIDDQMRISREAAKGRNPNPDHKAIRGRMLAKAPKTKDTRTDAQKMTDATGPRKGSNFRGD